MAVSFLIFVSSLSLSRSSPMFISMGIQMIFRGVCGEAFYNKPRNFSTSSRHIRLTIHLSNSSYETDTSRTEYNEFN